MVVSSYRDAADSVQQAIDFGELAAQRAPAGHPIFDALTRARATKQLIDDGIPWYSNTGPDAGPAIISSVDQAAADIYDAAASIRTDPDRPLSPTVYQHPTPLPWGWIGAGVAVVIGTALILYGSRRPR